MLSDNTRSSDYVASEAATMLSKGSLFVNEEIVLLATPVGCPDQLGSMP